MFNESFAQLVKQLGIAANVSNVAHDHFVFFCTSHRINGHLVSETLP